MIELFVLENEDTIISGDWVRPLKLTYDGQSDTLQTSSPYSGGRINRLGWIRVDEYMPAIIGSSLQKFYSKKWHHPPEQLEIVRGAIPFHHQEDGVTTWHVSTFNKPTRVDYSKGEMK